MDITPDTEVKDFSYNDKMYSTSKLSAILDDSRNCVEINWASLYILKDDNKLVPGMQYRITDYAASTSQYETSATESVRFDLVVTAVGKDQLSEHAKAAKHEDDDYFAGSDLGAWDVWYCLDNDKNRFAWASNTGKGVIYRMIDEFGNDCPYDFKSIKFNDKFTFDAGNGVDASLNKNGIKVYDNTIKPSYDSNKQMLNNIVFNCENYECYSNSFGYNCFNNTFARYCYSNVFEDRFVNNSVGGTFYSNKFGYDCTGNTFNGACQSNTIGSFCDNNIFEYSSKNTIGSNCNRLTFKNCSNNTVGNDCSALTLGVDNGVAEENKISDECKSITMPGGCRRNIINTKSSNISFGESCQQNIIGAWCRNITFGDSCGDNTLGSNCSNIVVGGSFSHNRVGNYCSLSAGNDCARNEFAGYNRDIAFGNGCRSNKLGVGCMNITFGTKSKIRSNYCDNVIENDNSYIQLDAVNVEDGAAGGVYRFVTVKPGVNIKDDFGKITTLTITDTNKNQLRQTVYQPGPAEVINPFMASRADLIHRWSFNNSFEDTGSIGGKTAVLGGNAELYGGTSVRLTRGGSGTSFVELGTDPVPSGLGDTPFTIEVWATPTSLDTYRGIFSLGERSSASAKGLMGVFQGYRQIREGGETESGPVWQAVAGNLVKKDGESAGTEQNVAMTYGNISAGTPYYFAYVVKPKGDGDSATVVGYVYNAASCVSVGKSLEYTVTGWTTAQLSQSWFGLGTTPWNDAAPGADYDEVRVWKKALTANQIKLNVELGPDAVFQ